MYQFQYHIISYSNSEWDRVYSPTPILLQYLEFSFLSKYSLWQHVGHSEQRWHLSTQRSLGHLRYLLNIPSRPSTCASPVSSLQLMQIIGQGIFPEILSSNSYEFSLFAYTLTVASSPAVISLSPPPKNLTASTPSVELVIVCLLNRIFFLQLYLQILTLKSEEPIATLSLETSIAQTQLPAYQRVWVREYLVQLGFIVQTRTSLSQLPVMIDVPFQTDFIEQIPLKAFFMVWKGLQP